jgi:uncharacterized protein with HEPN domain
MQRDAATLLDIVKAAQLVQTFLGASTKADFMSDIKTQSAVVYQLTIIGEAVKRLSRPFRDEHSHVPGRLLLVCVIISSTGTMRSIWMRYGIRRHRICRAC